MANKIILTYENKELTDLIRNAVDDQEDVPAGYHIESVGFVVEDSLGIQSVSVEVKLVKTEGLQR